MNLVLSQSVWLTLATAVVLPMLVALVTKQDAHSGIKAVALLFLSSVAGVLSAALDASNSGQAFDWGHAVVGALIAFAWAVLAHLGVLKPIAVTGSQGVIQVKIPGGVG